MCEFPDAYGKPYYDAVDMAISALQEQELKQEVKNSKKSSLTQNALDTISRQAAIDAVHKAGITEYDETLAIEEIERVPPAQPEQKKGQWINVRHDNVAECNRCGAIGRAWMNFCFDCGADMRGEKNDDES
jgi:hypothetical protein